MEVVEDAAEDATSEVGGRRVRKVYPANTLVPDPIHALVLERHPSHLALGVDKFERREPLKRPAVDPVTNRALCIVGVERHRHRKWRFGTGGRHGRR